MTRYGGPGSMKRKSHTKSHNGSHAKSMDLPEIFVCVHNETPFPPSLSKFYYISIISV